MSSNTLYIWDPLRHGLPKTFEEASAILSKLSEGVKDRPNNSIIDFAQRIQDLVRLNPESDAELLHYYGNFVGVALKHEKALFTVDLPPDQSLEMMRTIVQTANPLPLVVFNDLLGLASVGWVEARNPSQSIGYALFFGKPLPLSKPNMMGFLRLPILQKNVNLNGLALGYSLK